MLLSMYPEHHAREKLTSLICTLLRHQFAELPAADRNSILHSWRSLHREAQAAYRDQRANTGGYGGSTAALPDMATVRQCVDDLPKGDRTRLALMLCTMIPWKDPWRCSAPLLNLGAVKVYTLVNYTHAPTAQQMQQQARVYLSEVTQDESDTGAAGWLTLHPKTQKMDAIYLLMGVLLDENGKERTHIQMCPLPKLISDELRSHYLPQRRSQPWLFADLAHKNVADSPPYLCPGQGVFPEIY